MKFTSILLSAVALAPSIASAKLEVDEVININLGFTVQARNDYPNVANREYINITGVATYAEFVTFDISELALSLDSAYGNSNGTAPASASQVGPLVTGFKKFDRAVDKLDKALITAKQTLIDGGQQRNLSLALKHLNTSYAQWAGFVSHLVRNVEALQTLDSSISTTKTGILNAIDAFAS